MLDEFVQAFHDYDNDGEDMISNLRNGAVVENALAIMQEKGFSNQRRSRHRLTPGTVKFAAFHVLSLEGSNGLTILEVAEKIHLTARPRSPESLQQLVEVARNPTTNPTTFFAIFAGEDNTRQAIEQKAPGLYATSREDYNIVESVESYPAEWYRMCELPGANDAACAHYVLQLQQSGLLKGDDLSNRFFCCLTVNFLL
ncbi:Homeobox-DDT domain protein RLT2 [Camellia lanceoleosa]|uniref:Homeobox-DDT domain protein RLT2 n=1 Tax=Camellia lanceoleosa TaxID=1840588 RepID=A0ACC0I7X4_9ERIC|nr:Homeobox-DDT domain protein RLT2 [Camellia lanceoleosa]